MNWPLITREYLIGTLEGMGLDWGDEEDAVALVDVLLETYSPDGVYIWLFFHNSTLGGTPLHLLELGRQREVLLEARRLVGQVAT